MDELEKQILIHLADSPEVCLWLIDEINRMVNGVVEKQGKHYMADRIRWSEYTCLPLEGVYDSIRNNTPRNRGLYDKFIVHEGTGRVFKIGYSY